MTCPPNLAYNDVITGQVYLCTECGKSFRVIVRFAGKIIWEEVITEQCAECVRLRVEIEYLRQQFQQLLRLWEASDLVVIKAAEAKEN
jgi:hypothetical protein